MLIKTPKLRLVLGLVSTQTDEMTVRSSADGWKIAAVSPDHVSMILADMPANTFDDYEDFGDFAVSLKNLTKAVSSAGPVCEIIVKDGTFRLSSDGMSSKFPLIAGSDKEQKTPNIEYHAGATLSVGELTRITAAVFGSVDAYSITLKDETLTVAAEDTSKNGVTLTIPKDKCLSINGTARSTFSIESMDRFLKALPKDAVTDISLGNNMPVTFDLQDEYMKIKYLLAPRIETE